MCQALDWRGRKGGQRDCFKPGASSFSLKDCECHSLEQLRWPFCFILQRHDGSQQQLDKSLEKNHTIEQFEDLDVVSTCWHIKEVSMVNPALQPVKNPQSHLKLHEVGLTILYRWFCLLEIYSAVAKHIFYDTALFFFVHITPDLGCVHNVVIMSCWEVYYTVVLEGVSCNGP